MTSSAQTNRPVSRRGVFRRDQVVERRTNRQRGSVVIHKAGTQAVIVCQRRDIEKDGFYDVRLPNGEIDTWYGPCMRAVRNAPVLAVPAS